ASTSRSSAIASVPTRSRISDTRREGAEHVPQVAERVLPVNDFVVARLARCAPSCYDDDVDTAGRVNIFTYADYRAFLRDFYREQKTKGSSFSHRAFSRRAGLRSSNYLHLVMKGERDLSSEMAVRFARGCGLGKTEADYFCELVAYGQARTHDERNRCY